MLSLPSLTPYLIISCITTHFDSSPIHTLENTPASTTMVANLPLHALSKSDGGDGSRISHDPAEGPRTWNPSNVQEDDSWEVKAFAKDTSGIMGATWPPMSYTCTFCRREFRSAQALGGHMNVHRKDRARLNQSQFLNTYNNLISTSSSPSLAIPAGPEFVSAGGLCFLYQNPHSNGAISPVRMSGPCLDSSPSSSKTFIPIPNYNTSTPRRPPLNPNLRGQPYPQDASGRSAQRSSYGGIGHNRFKSAGVDPKEEELDLELRLGK